jgi:hypothetical protein
MTTSSSDLAEPVARAAGFIAEHQERDGAIPSLRGGPVHPWNHVESAMALDAAGQHERAVLAYQWVAEVQEDDGSLCGAYLDGRALDGTREANFATYIAFGAWHHYRLTRDVDFLRGLWPTITRAVEFALALQAEDGSIYWARDADGNPWPDSLVAGSACIRASIRCAERIGVAVGDRLAVYWRARRKALEAAIRSGERGWGGTFPEDTSRYAMHWYYPVLCGVIAGERAQGRLRAGWTRFMRDGYGCLCVEDRPWVTVAESCELAIALDVCGQRDEARSLLQWQVAHQEADGGFRTGTVARYGAWPDGDRPTWTAAAVVLAADALYDLTPAGGLFRSLAP